MANYQTLSEFLNMPFGKKGDAAKLREYSEKYSSFRTSNKISLKKISVIEGSYYYHIQVPSESQHGTFYDVVIRFFSDDSAIREESNIKRYYLQFFSNSPSFIYQYAYVYKINGYLIQSMYDKLDQNYINTAPEKTNAGLNVSFDKSIYFACRYLHDEKEKYLNKQGLGVQLKKVSPDQFFRGISDFESKKFDQLLLNEEKKLTANLKHAKETPTEPEESANNHKAQVGKIITPKKKIAGSAHVVKKTTPKKSTTSHK